MVRDSLSKLFKMFVERRWLASFLKSLLSLGDLLRYKEFLLHNCRRLASSLPVATRMREPDHNALSFSRQSSLSAPIGDMVIKSLYYRLQSRCDTSYLTTRQNSKLASRELEEHFSSWHYSHGGVPVSQYVLPPSWKIIKAFQQAVLPRDVLFGKRADASHLQQRFPESRDRAVAKSWTPDNPLRATDNGWDSHRNTRSPDLFATSTDLVVQAPGIS